MSLCVNAGFVHIHGIHVQDVSVPDSQFPVIIYFMYTHVSMVIVLYVYKFGIHVYICVYIHTNRLRINLSNHIRMHVFIFVCIYTYVMCPTFLLPRVFSDFMLYVHTCQYASMCSMYARVLCVYTACTCKFQVYNFKRALCI